MWVRLSKKYAGHQLEIDIDLSVLEDGQGAFVGKDFRFFAFVINFVCVRVSFINSLSVRPKK